jgi:hypothetical protein
VLPGDRCLWFSGGSGGQSWGGWEGVGDVVEMTAVVPLWRRGRYSCPLFFLPHVTCTFLCLSTAVVPAAEATIAFIEAGRFTSRKP